MYGYRDPSTGLSGRATPEQIKAWYSELATLLNRLEGAGEELTLIDTETSREVRGLTSRVRKTAPAIPGTWSKE